MKWTSNEVEQRSNKELLFGVWKNKEISRMATFGFYSSSFIMYRQLE